VLAEAQVASEHQNSHIQLMPRSAGSSPTPDLFDYLPAPPQRSRRILPKVAPPVADLGSLSDARLARLLVDTATELKRRRSGSSLQQTRPEVSQAIQEAALLLQAMAPKRAGQGKRSSSSEPPPSLQAAKRKAIRAALQAGVAPGQVAKHFGLSLAALRKALAAD
jgi:hypothetical protein